MKLHILFIGDTFIYNDAFSEYILRNIRKRFHTFDSLKFLKKSDNSLFLELEESLHTENNIIIVSTKQNFSTVGKVISTVTGDNQVLQNGMLVPSQVVAFHERTYLLHYKHATVNVIQIDEAQKMPQLLLEHTNIEKCVHVFEEDKATLENILQPIAQTYNVYFTLTKIVDGWLRVAIHSSKYGEIDNFIQAAKNLLPKKLIATSNMIEYIIELLAKKSKKVTFAESCTGGLLSYLFTKHNGASQILDGSLVTYSNSLKENWLAVSEEVLEAHGAVSAEVVEEMSEGALSVSHADYAMAISGIAGESGGTEQKPVGTVYIGVRTQNDHKEEHCFFEGDRNYIQEQSAYYAVKMMILLDKETFF